MSYNESTADAVDLAFMTMPAADVERAKARIEQLEHTDPEGLTILEALLDMCRREYPIIKIVGVDDVGEIKFQRIHSVLDAPRGRA
jgi:methylase of polypeptide subunit release factors